MLFNASDLKRKQKRQGGKKPNFFVCGKGGLEFIHFLRGFWGLWAGLTMLLLLQGLCDPTHGCLETPRYSTKEFICASPKL